MKTIEKLIDQYFEHEMRWSKIIEFNYNNPSKILKSHKHHRVLKYKNKIIKIQYLGIDSEVPENQTILNEYEIYKINNKIYDYNAKLKKLDDDWFALEIDILRVKF